MNTPTSVQMDALLAFLEDHRELARGHSRNAEGRHHSRNLWATLTEELNALGGCIKNVKQWQKVWADKKYLAKKSNATARQSASATGGGPSTGRPLTDQEQKIIRLMGEGFGEPETDARVPAFPQNNPPQQDFVVELVELPEQVILPAPPSPNATSSVAEEDSGPAPQQQPNEGPAQHGTTNAVRAERRRVRQRTALATEGPMRWQFMKIEQERVAAESQHAKELTLIREAIVDLKNVIQAGFSQLNSRR